jgi:hypothetical protein
MICLGDHLVAQRKIFGGQNRLQVITHSCNVKSIGFELVKSTIVVKFQGQSLENAEERQIRLVPATRTVHIFVSHVFL